MAWFGAMTDASAFCVLGHAGIETPDGNSIARGPRATVRLAAVASPAVRQVSETSERSALAEKCLDFVACDRGAVFGSDLGSEFSGPPVESLIGQEPSHAASQVAVAADPNFAGCSCLANPTSQCI